MRRGTEEDKSKRLTPIREDIKNTLAGRVGIASDPSVCRDIVFHEMIFAQRIKKGQGVTPPTKAHKMGLVFRGHMRGEFSINRESWKKNALVEGEMYVTPGGDEMGWAGETIDNQELICLGFHLSPVLVANTMQDVFDKEPIAMPLQLEINKKDTLLSHLILSIYSELKENKQQGTNYLDVASQFLITHILHQQYKKKLPLKEYKTALDKYVLQNILTHIDDHLSRKITVNELAKLANMSVFHFVRIFKKSMGSSPHQYVIKQRMRRADKLLKHTSLSITQISLDVGYEEVCNFSAAYKKYKGISPKAFRISQIY